MTTPAALISRCNEALAEIGAAQIQDFEENSVEAANCRIFAPALLLELAEWADIPSLVVRQTLAVVTNDRDAEWNHAYAAPSDMVYPMYVRAKDDAAYDLPVFGPLPVHDSLTLRYMIEGGKVYTNVENATLVYTSSDLEASGMTATLGRAFALELAARLAYPVKKDMQLKQAKMQEAQIAKGLAIAAEQNRSQRFQTTYISEAELARMGDA